MTHICYIYIFDYQCLKNIGVSFDHRYNYAFNDEKMELTISAPSSKLPETFWSPGIWSLTGIVGNNGAGKTTVNRFLLDAVVEGLTTKDIKGIYVYENQGKLDVYYNVPQNAKGVRVISPDAKIGGIKKIDNGSTSLPSIETFYYQGHFSAEFSSADLCTIELSGLYNASEGCLIRKDLEKFANATDLYFNGPMSSYLVSHISQKHNRICRLLINSELRSEIHDFHFPRYITLAPNRGGQDHLKLHPLVSDDLRKSLNGMLDPLPIAGLVPTREESIGMYIYFNMLNVIADGGAVQIGTEVLKEWRDTVDTSHDVLSQFKAFIGKQIDASTRKVLDVIYSVLFEVLSDLNFSDYGFFYFDAFNEVDKVEKLLSISEKTQFFYLTSRFYDLHYSHNVNSSNSFLSSGEEEMLNLFSLLYDAIEIQPLKFPNLKAPRLLILDEAEIGFHPEWQRSYINTLLGFVTSLKVCAGHDYQVIITTHSPILLSDIPSCCCNFLERRAGGVTYNVRDVQPQTFATNVFELYRNSFFLHKGLIGQYAEEKLKKLETKCKSGSQDVGAEIELIGDSRLQQYFVSLLAKNDKAAAIRYYEEQIRRLEEGEL